MHPFADLSAYLDGALGAKERASVSAHLETCSLCAMRLTELRATARLMAALPSPVPRRSLVPRVSVPVWFAPIRTLATMGSGAAALLFIASSVLALAPTTQTGGAGGPASAEFRNTAPGAAAPAAGAPVPSPSPAPTGVATDSDARQAAGRPSPQRELQATATPDPLKAMEAQRTGAAPATAPDAPGRTRTDESRPELTGVQYASDTVARPQLWLSTWAWLAVAVGLGGLALFLHRRLVAA